MQTISLFFETVKSPCNYPPNNEAPTLSSQRELEIRLLGQGRCNREIAEAQHLIEGAVKTHITNISNLR